MSSSKSNANPLDIDGVEHVRKRPGMYIGGVDQRGLHHLFHIALDTPLLQALNGDCRNITIMIENGEQLTVTYDGGGLTLTSIPNHDAPFMELAFTIFVPPSYDPLNRPDQLLGSNIISG